MAVLRSPLASWASNGTAIFRPGTLAYMDSTDQECVEPSWPPAPLLPRNTIGTGNWPPVETPPVDCTESRILRNTERVVWPHRWEHDKGAEELLDLATRHSDELNLRWTILGEQFRTAPSIFAETYERLKPRILHRGFVPSRSEYEGILRRCDVVVSTAIQENFGIAVAEAILAGCQPLLPNRASSAGLFLPIQRFASIDFLPG